MPNPVSSPHGAYLPASCTQAPGGGWILCLVLFLSLFVAVPAQSQTATVSGFVTDATNGQPLELASVSLLQDGQLLHGAATNRDGLFLLPRINPGSYTLQASFIGYQTFTDTIALAPGEVLTRTIALRPEEAALGEVLVQAERTSGAARVTAGQQTIRPQEVELVPTPDVSGDLASYLSAMPGVVSTADRGGQLFIRGGEPSQNLVLLDGMTLYQPFHILGFYSAFPTEILSRADVYAGGFPSRFGGRLSSVIDVVARPGNDRRLAGTASLSPFVSSATLEGPLVRERFSFLASVRQSVLEQGAEQLLQEALPFRFGDVFVKLHGQLSSNSRGSVSALRTYDRGRLGQAASEAVEAEEVRWQNRALGLRYVVLPRILPVTATLQVSHSGLEAELGAGEAAASRRSMIEQTEVVLDATFFGRRINMDAGLAVQLATIETELGGVYQNVESRSTKLDLVSYYLEPEFRLGAGFRLRPGLRLQFFASRFEPFLEPRLRLVFERSRHQVSAAAGLYHQEIVGLSDRRDAASVFTAWSVIPPERRGSTDVLAGRIPRALHVILGWRFEPSPTLELSLEGFYKELENLFIAEWTAFPRFTTRLQPARGRSLGLDARLELRRGPFYGYVSYGLSSTLYEAEQAALSVWYGQERLRFRPGHDRRHQVGVLVSGRLWGVEVSGRWQFGSGLPFSRAVGFDGFVLINDIVNAAELPSSRRVIYERPYNALLPAYHRLDVSLERSFRLGAAALTLQLSAINLYDRRNLFYLDVFTLQRADQLPFVPSLGIKVGFE